MWAGRDGTGECYCYSQDWLTSFVLAYFVFSRINLHRVGQQAHRVGQQGQGRLRTSVVARNVVSQYIYIYLSFHIAAFY
jgi:hypothetical protein